MHQHGSLSGFYRDCLSFLDNFLVGIVIPAIRPRGNPDFAAIEYLRGNVLHSWKEYHRKKVRSNPALDGPDGIRPGEFLVNEF